MALRLALVLHYASLLSVAHGDLEISATSALFAALRQLFAALRASLCATSRLFALFAAAHRLSHFSPLLGIDYSLFRANLDNIFYFARHDQSSLWAGG